MTRVVLTGTASSLHRTYAKCLAACQARYGMENGERHLRSMSLLEALALLRPHA